MSNEHKTPTSAAVEVEDNGRFNISRWALQHPDLTRYLMIVLMVLGLAAYFQLGQDEDPPFTFRAMVVQAYWPGASAKDVAEQVTDKIERTLQEVPYSDKIRSYTKPGESLTILQLADWSPGHEVPNTWYQARKKIGDMRSTLPPGVIGPFFNDEFGDVYGSIYALSADGFSDEELRVRAEDIRSQLLRVHDVAKVELFGVQAQKIWVELSQKRAAEMGVDVNGVISQLNAQNAVQGSGVVDAGTQNVQVRVAGAFQSVDAIRALPIRVVNPATGQATSIKLGDVADVKRGYSDPPDVKVRANGKQVIASTSGIVIATTRPGQMSMRIGLKCSPRLTKLTSSTITMASISTRTNSPTERATACGWSCTCASSMPTGSCLRTSATCACRSLPSEMMSPPLAIEMPMAITCLPLARTLTSGGSE